MKTRTAKKVIVLHAANRVRYRVSTIVRCVRQLRAAAKREQRLTDPTLTLIPSLPYVSDIVYLRCSSKRTAQWYTSRPQDHAGMTQRALFPESRMPSWARPRQAATQPLVPWPGRHHQELVAGQPTVPELVVAMDAAQLFADPSLCPSDQRDAISAGLTGESALYATRTIQEMRVHQIAATDARRSEAARADLAAMRAGYTAEELAQ